MAKDFATKAHQGQTRKNSNVPYITHPVRVAERLEKEGFSDELICAAYLHDVVEDTPYEIEEIEKTFGSRVAKFVAAHTEDKSKSWDERKLHTINTVKHAENDVKYLIVADKLDNLLGLEHDLKTQRETVWNKFNAGIEKQRWYNQSIAENMYVGVDPKDVPEYFAEYADTVARVFG
ncbi:HD domain-containing protein [Virgibacillus phasianinus]